MYELPTSVEIDGELFRIRDKGDFRMVLHCFKILNAEDLSHSEKIIACLQCFYEGLDELEDVLTLSQETVEELSHEMFEFMSAGQEESKDPVKLIDWEQDELLITSAINKVAGKEIRSEKNIHWWTFVGYYIAIGECALSQIVGIRHKIAHGTKLEKGERKFVAENPQYFNIDYRSAEQKAEDEYYRKLWNGGNA